MPGPRRQSAGSVEIQGARVDMSGAGGGNSPGTTTTLWRRMAATRGRLVPGRLQQPDPEEHARPGGAPLRQPRQLLRPPPAPQPRPVSGAAQHQGQPQTLLS